LKLAQTLQQWSLDMALSTSAGLIILFDLLDVPRGQTSHRSDATSEELEQM